MSGTSPRPPTRSPEDEHAELERSPLEDLEELGDDAIIAQQAVPHAPQPRANVAEESRSVVITEHPRRADTEPPRAPRPPPRRSSVEATLVIRDRRALDELRTQIERGRHKRDSRRRPIYLWGALGLAAFVLGGVVAFLATEGQTAAVPTPPGRIEAKIAVSPTAPPAPLKTAEPATLTHAVRLDDLPVEPPPKH